MLHKNLYLTLLTAFCLALAGCSCRHDGKKLPAEITTHASTGIEYAPDMYHSLALDPYSQLDYNHHFADGKNLNTPVVGSIARGKLSYYYPYPNTNEGYEKAGKELKDPFPPTPEVLAEGKRLFTLYCVHCHGAKGDGGGPVSGNGGGPFAGVPAYYDEAHKNLPEGKMYHSITYGKNLMGSHASQVSPEERWKLVRYVQQLQKAAITTPDTATANTKAADKATPRGDAGAKPADGKPATATDSKQPSGKNVQ